MRLFMLGILSIVSSLVVAQQSMLAVVNKSDNSISIIDLSSKSIIETLPTGNGPHELVLASDGKYAVSSDFVGGNSLTVFNLETLKVERSISLEKYPFPHGIHVLNNGNEVLVTSGQSKNLVKVDVLKGEITDVVSTKQNTSHMVSSDSKNKYAYVTNIRSDSISKIQLSDFSLHSQIKTAKQPEAIKVSPDNKFLWYGANQKGLVTVLDLSSEKQVAQFDGFAFPYRVLFNHDGSVAMVPDFRKNELRFFDAKNLVEVGRIDLGEGAGPQGITLHASKNIAYLSLNTQNKVVAIDIKDRKIIAEYPTGNNPDGIVYFTRNISG